MFGIGVAADARGEQVVGWSEDGDEDSLAIGFDAGCQFEAADAGGVGGSAGLLSDVPPFVEPGVGGFVGSQPVDVAGHVGGHGGDGGAGPGGEAAFFVDHADLGGELLADGGAGFEGGLVEDEAGVFAVGDGVVGWGFGSDEGEF